MKLAYPIATPEASGPLMAFSGDFEKNVATIQAIGYEGLELYMRDVLELKSSYVQKVIVQSGLEVAAIGLGPAVRQDGLSLLHSDKSIRQESLARILRTVDFAADYNAPVCIGKIRGQLWKGNEQAALVELSRAMDSICCHAQKKGVPICIEPQQDMNNLCTTKETAAFIKKIGCAGLGILFDTYHADLTEVSLAAGILGTGGNITFVHCSDSNRYPPGTGKLHLTDALATLIATGYDGYISMEIMQKPDSDTTAKLAYQIVRYILDDLTQTNSA